MTATEVVADPMGPVVEGRAVADYPGYDNADHGIWTRRSYTWCAAAGPRTQYACSRPIGHPASWNHIACTEGGHGGRGTVHEVWGAVALEPDPCADVTISARVRDHGYPALICAPNSDDWCRQQAPDSSAVCSRPRGHAAHWQHIAATSSTVIAVWGGDAEFVDPHASVYESQLLREIARWDNNVTGIRVANERYCRETKEGRTPGAFCTRAIGHEGKHISTNSTRVLWVKDNPKVVAPVEPPDPEDGSPVDDESIVYTEAPEVGDVVRLRDRRNRLYVMSQRRDTPEVEVLDLERKELRAIPVDRCVKQDDPLTIDELQWVAQWYSGHRDAVRKIAVREYRKDRWCMAGLNQNLRELGLQSYEPTLHGTINVQLPFDCSNIHAGQDEIESKVTAALANPEVSAALRVALPLIDGIELLPDEMTVRATNFNRK